MVRATISDIGRAIEQEMMVWYIEQRMALNEVSWPSIEGGDPEIFKGAAMYNWGVDATKKMFPNSTTRQLVEDAQNAISRSYAMPLFIVGLASDSFKKMHKEAIDETNRQLSANYRDLKGDFIDKLQAHNRTFSNSPHGRHIAALVYPFVSDIEYSDGTQMRAHLREFIHQADLVVTDPSSIRDRTTRGIERVAQEMRDIWWGSYHMPWYHTVVMYYSGSSQTYMYANGRQSVEWNRVQRREDQDWVIKNSWRMSARRFDRGFFEKGTDEVRVRLVNRGEPTRLAAPYFPIDSNHFQRARAIADRQL